jgi:hypothetical protein
MVHDNLAHVVSFIEKIDANMAGEQGPGSGRSKQITPSGSKNMDMTDNNSIKEEDIEEEEDE